MVRKLGLWYLLRRPAVVLPLPRSLEFWSFLALIAPGRFGDLIFSHGAPFAKLSGAKAEWCKSSALQ